MQVNADYLPKQPAVMGNPVSSILAWVLDKMPKIRYSKIESFLLLFQASQNYFMANPTVLNTMLRLFWRSEWSDCF
jgi:hypothetical protein